MNVVVCVDPSKNSFQLIQLLSIQNGLHPQLGQSQGVLHYIVAINHTLEVWILDSLQQWVQKHQLPFNLVFGVPEYGLLYYELFSTAVNLENPVALHPEEDILCPFSKWEADAFRLEDSEVTRA
jgi:hypothetical protein